MKRDVYGVFYRDGDLVRGPYHGKVFGTKKAVERYEKKIRRRLRKQTRLVKVHISRV